MTLEMIPVACGSQLQQESSEGVPISSHMYSNPGPVLHTLETLLFSGNTSLQRGEMLRSAL